MLYYTLILSALLLGFVNWLAFGAKRPADSILWLCVGFATAPMFMLLFSPTLIIQAILIGVAWLLWRTSTRGPAYFLALSCGATLMAYTFAGMDVLRIERRLASLRDRFPFESMEARLRVIPDADRSDPLPPDMLSHLERVERKYGSYGWDSREPGLRHLHENTVGLFINSPAFGISRMSNWLFISELADYPESGPVPTQPGPPFTSQSSPGSLNPVSADERLPMGPLLDDSIVDFAKFDDFGYFKDRRHVAGFLPHQFSTVPELKSRWKVQRLELVSLLLHDEPSVYVSKSLPQMNKTHNLPTRPLNEFEQYGLSALRNGGDLFSSQDRQGVRLLGAIRSTNQCVDCHGGTRGNLLGAFSYTLRSVGPGADLLGDSPY